MIGWNKAGSPDSMDGMVYLQEVHYLCICMLQYLLAKLSWN